MIALYDCTQDELYEIARCGWQSYLDNLADFADFSAANTAGLATTRNTEIDNAQDAPGERARKADHEVKRVGLAEQAAICLDLWQQLERYIDHAYADPSIKKVRTDEAGKKDYEKAREKNWENVKSILVSGKNFITNHSADLLAGANMPANFPATFNGARSAFLPLLTGFIASEMGTPAGTTNKLSLNNSVYKNLMMMFEDGKWIYRNNSAKKKLFTFSDVKKLISSPGAAGANITVVDAVSFFGLVGVTVNFSLPSTPVVIVLTDANGLAKFPSLSVGSYTVTIVFAGYVTKTFIMKITTGVHSRRRIELVRG